jgi:ribosomal protein S18 acetylase RimI-like enzyme
MRATLGEMPFPAIAGLRPPSDADVQRLASLMYSANRGTVDDEGESEADALVEVQKTFAGAYGSFVPSCAAVVERNGRLLSATLVTRWQDRPFVAFSMTEPSSKRTGLARACMMTAMSRLHAAGERELSLVVTLANLPAFNLYSSLGFVMEE